MLRSVFSNYKGCHFIIATHSPLLISRLSNRNCFILRLDDQKIYDSEKYTKRSADYQLATLFNTPGRQNEYLNREAIVLLSKLSKHGKLKKDELIVAEELFEKIPLLDDTDNVKKLILLLEKALEQLGND